MNVQPGSVAEPDPEEPVQRWEVTSCEHCHRTIWRPIGRLGSAREWLHVSGFESCTEGWRP